MKFQYENSEGGVVIVHAAPQSDLERVLGPMTEENYMAHVVGKSVPAGVRKIFVMSDDWRPPESRNFRNAWSITEDGQIGIDMAKARDIQRDLVRVDRKPMFEKLDVEQLRRISAGDISSAEEIEKEKQRLRDAPAHPAIEAAKDADELAAITLSALLAI